MMQIAKTAACLAQFQIGDEKCDIIIMFETYHIFFSALIVNLLMHLHCEQSQGNIKCPHPNNEMHVFPDEHGYGPNSMIIRI